MRLGYRFWGLLGCVGLAFFCVYLSIAWLAREEDDGKSEVAEDSGSESLRIAKESLRRVAAVSEETPYSLFNAWVERWRVMPSDDLLEKGLALADSRADRMRVLIAEDPEQAIRLRLPYEDYVALPPQIAERIERPFSTTTDVNAVIACSFEESGSLAVAHSHDTEYRALVEGSEHRLFFPSSRQGMSSKRSVPLTGVRLAGIAAVQSEAISILRESEAAAASRLFSAELDAGGKTLSVLFGKSFLPGVEAQVAMLLNEAIADAEKMIGLNTVEAVVSAIAQGERSTEKLGSVASDQANEWGASSKRVLFWNAKFSSEEGGEAVATNDEWSAIFDELSDWFEVCSYGKVHLDVTIVPEVIALPGTMQHYNEEGGDEFGDADELSLELGYDYRDYDIVIISFPKLSKRSYAGVALLGGYWQRLNGTASKGVIAHELGHNLGLQHESSWESDDGSSMPHKRDKASSESGHVEYGDVFSVMGNSGSYPQGQYSPFGKSRLGWFESSHILSVREAGTYRIYRMDADELLDNRSRALTFSRGDSELFWLGYRRAFGDLPRDGYEAAGKGAYVQWQFESDRSRLLDMTPQTLNAKDQILQLGETFADPSDLLYVTPIAQGEDVYGEWLDVRIDYLLDGNSNPVLEETPIVFPLNAREDGIEVNAVATDPDGDELEYEWDFGNGQFVSGSELSWYPLAGGERELTLRIRDGSGGLIERTYSVEVVDPAADFERVSVDGVPHYATINDVIPFNGGYVGVTSENQIVQSDDGEEWARVVELPYGRYFALESNGSSVITVSSDGVVAYSEDLKNWQWFSITDEDLRAVVYGYGKYFAVGSGGVIFSSPDGQNWTLEREESDHWYFTAEMTEYGLFVGGLDWSGGGSLLKGVGDGEWTPVDSTISGTVASLAEGDGILTIVSLDSGSDTYYRSVDGGETWDALDFGLKPFVHAKTITYGEGLWFAMSVDRVLVGSTNTIDFYITHLAVSSDGIEWDLMGTSWETRNSPNISKVMEGRHFVFVNDAEPGSPSSFFRSALLKNVIAVEELGNASTDAFEIEAGVDFTGSIEAVGDEDWFEYTLNQPSRIQFWSTLPDGSDSLPFEPMIGVYRNGELRAFKKLGEDGDRYLDIQSAGVYQFRIYSSSGGKGAYSIRSNLASLGNTFSLVDVSASTRDGLIEVSFDSAIGFEYLIEHSQNMSDWVEEEVMTAWNRISSLKFSVSDSDEPENGVNAFYRITEKEPSFAVD